MTAATGNIVEAVLVHAYERDMIWVLGLDHTAPVDVTVLEDPPRLIIDVAH